MVDFPQKQILADRSVKDFVSRAEELERLLHHAKKGGKAGGLLLSCAPGVGASELLKQTYDRLFSEPADIVPIYFSLNKKDTAYQSACRFVQQFLLQTVAFRRREPSLLDISPEISELAEFAIPADADWIDRVIKTVNRETNERTLIQNAFSSPLRAAAGGAKIFVMIDDLHQTAHFEGGVDIAAELQDIFGRSDVPLVLAGRRRFLSSISAFERFDLEPFSFRAAGDMVVKLADKNQIKINEQTRDLIAAQFNGNAKLIDFFLQAAAGRQTDITC